MIISKTPLRISFAGGGTDLRAYYKHNRYGAVLSTSIDSYIYISVKKQTSLFQEKYRLFLDLYYEFVLWTENFNLSCL